MFGYSGTFIEYIIMHCVVLSEQARTYENMNILGSSNMHLARMSTAVAAAIPSSELILHGIPVPIALRVDYL